MVNELGYVTYDGMQISEAELKHYGILRKSGRYPWGSGENPFQRNRAFVDYIDALKKDGLSETEIAAGIGISTTKLRAVKALAKHEIRAEQESQARRLKEKGVSNVEIGRIMGLNESSVRGLLDPSAKAKNDVLFATANEIKKQVDEKKYVDIGKGVSNTLGISDVKMNTAISMLEEQGYTVFNNLRVEQVGLSGQYTTRKVLTKPGTDFKELFENRHQVQIMNSHTDDGGRTYSRTDNIPKSISSKRVKIRYAEDGGTDADGVMYIRPGAEGLSLGNSRYAQVRVAVDGTHYIKGMAVYKDNLPDGVDILFNTNKSNTGNKLDALKKMKDDPENPFGTNIKPGGKRGYLNIVNEEGDWEQWGRKLSSQMLSKQSPELAQRQLELYYNKKKADLDDIRALTNPVIKKRLLQAAADDYDAASVHLKAAGIPRMANHVILPVNTLKPNEVYAPNFKNGEKVVLIRHPHGGIFEIPELTVNNKNPEAKKMITNRSKDAIGIHSKAAMQLSGADFDGDTVMVIPNNNGAIKYSKPLAGLKDFDPQSAYPGYPGMKKMSREHKQIEMGVASNLITDMTILGASTSEIARAVRYSMVVIDAEKHGLNYRQAAKDNGIRELKKKYQPNQSGTGGGASTLISRSSSKVRVPHRKARSMSEGGPIDKVTGEKVYTYTGEGYINKKGKYVERTVKSKRMAEVKNAFDLSSGTEIEKIYATHANKLKALANDARKDYISEPPLKYNPSAKKLYSKEIDTLSIKLDLAYKNKPLERQAQALANQLVKQKILANPDMDKDDLKKVKSHALRTARERIGTTKSQIYISDKEWEAIQNGAISNNRLVEIVSNADLDRVRELATPYPKNTVPPTKVSRAKNMADRGYTRAEIADALAISTSTLTDILGDG